MPDLRMREQTDQAELQAIADQSAERTACLRLAETVTDFLARLRPSAGTLDVSERQRILRLLVKDILVGDDKIVIRHSIPLPTNPSGGHPPKTNSPGPSPTQSESYLLRSGRQFSRCLRTSTSTTSSISGPSAGDGARATGDVIMVRYADDLCRRFPNMRATPAAFWDAMRDRLRKFSLSLHPDKTRLIEFGRFTAQNCKKRGLAEPENFKFLGGCYLRINPDGATSGSGGSLGATACGVKLQEIKEALQRRTNRPIPETGKWLAQVVAGYFPYHAVPTDGLALAARFDITSKFFGIGSYVGVAREQECYGRRWRNWQMSFSRSRRYSIRGPAWFSPLDTQGRSRVPEFGSLGYIQGALRNERPYRECENGGALKIARGAGWDLSLSSPFPAKIRS